MQDLHIKEVRSPHHEGDSRWIEASSSYIVYKIQPCHLICSYILQSEQSNQKWPHLSIYLLPHNQYSYLFVYHIDCLSTSCFSIQCVVSLVHDSSWICSLSVDFLIILASKLAIPALAACSLCLFSDSYPLALLHGVQSQAQHIATTPQENLIPCVVQEH